jgi:hypothetical protein
MDEKIYFSAALTGFLYESDRAEFENGIGWPADAVEISARWYEYLMAGQTSGKQIAANEYGQPVLTNLPLPTTSELIAGAESQKYALMQTANERIAPLQDAVELEIATGDEETLLLSLRRYRVLLSRVDTSAVPDPDWPEMPA